MSRYAENTSVSSEASRGEIERTLRRYGCDGFMYGWDRQAAVVGFQANGRRVKFMLPLPDPLSDEFRYTPERRRERSHQQREAVYEQAIKQRWRALALAIKAKLEAVETGITDFESEFLAHIVLPNGSTAGEWLSPQIEEAYRTGQMPPMIPALESGSSE